MNDRLVRLLLFAIVCLVPRMAQAQFSFWQLDGSGAIKPQNDNSVHLTNIAHLRFPSSASPSTAAAADSAFDTNAWGADRGALQLFDGTANTFLVGALVSDVPSAGQILKFNAGGTITWENLSVGSGSMTTVEEGDVQVGGADIVTLDFGAGFDVTESPDTEINLLLDYSEDPVNLATADITGDLPLANLTGAAAASKLLGRGDGGAGDWQEITLGTNLAMSGTTINATAGSTAWDAIGDPIGNGDVGMGATVQSLTWNPLGASLTVDYFTLNFVHDPAVDSLTQRGLVIQRTNSANAENMEILVEINNLDTDGSVDTAVLVNSSTGFITTAFEAADPEITNALSIGTNNILTETASLTTADLELLDDETITLNTETTGDYVAGVTAGAGISGSASGEGSNPTIAWSPETFVNSITLWNSANASRTLTFGLSGATDPVITASDAVLNLSAGTLQQGGVNVVLQNRTLEVAGTANEITSSAGALDLSANRTWTLSLPAALTLSGKELQGGTLFLAEGATANGFETTFAVEDPTADRTITFPDLTGTVILDAAGSLDDIVNGTGITVTGGADTIVGGNATISVDTGAAFTWSGVHDFTTTEAVKIPAGTSAQRPGTPQDGDLRVNTTTATTEIYRSAAWRDLEAGGGGGSSKFSVWLHLTEANMPASLPGIVDTGTTQHRILFDAGTDETVTWTNIPVWNYQGGNLVLTVLYSQDGTNTTDQVVVTGELWAMSDGDAADVDTESYGTLVSVTETVPDTAGRPGVLTITFDSAAELDNVAEGDILAVRLIRDANNGSDTAVGDWEVRTVLLEEQ